MGPPAREICQTDEKSNTKMILFRHTYTGHCMPVKKYSRNGYQVLPIAFAPLNPDFGDSFAQSSRGTRRLTLMCVMTHRFVNEQILSSRSCLEVSNAAPNSIYELLCFISSLLQRACNRRSPDLNTSVFRKIVKSRSASADHNWFGTYQPSGPSCRHSPGSYP